MKKLSIFCIISIVFVFTLSACGIDPAEKFNGRWEVSYITIWGRSYPYDKDDGFIEVNLQKDGTCMILDDDETLTGHYRIDTDGNAIVTFDDDDLSNYSNSFSVDENSMVWTLTDENNTQTYIYLLRVSTTS